MGRCLNKNDQAWDRYGGRGITVCERWRVFDDFLADMGLRPSPELSLDRINNDGNYAPGNVRWATRLEQARNRRRGVQRIVLAHGCWDLLHPGHLDILDLAKLHGERLVVSVTSDRCVNKGPGRPAFSQEHRMTMLRALRCVEAVVLSDAETAVDVIHALRPNVLLKGNDYAGGDPSGRLALERAAVEAVGGRLVISGHPKRYSSTAILKALA